MILHRWCDPPAQNKEQVLVYINWVLIWLEKGRHLAFIWYQNHVFWRSSLQEKGSRSWHFTLNLMQKNPGNARLKAQNIHKSAQKYFLLQIDPSYLNQNRPTQLVPVLWEQVTSTFQIPPPLTNHPGLQGVASIIYGLDMLRLDILWTILCKIIQWTRT